MTTPSSTLLTSFTNFLTVSIHSILYHRNLYPASTFLTTRALNLVVHQSRHPAVRTWITDAIAAITQQLRTASASSIALVIHSAPPNVSVLERWVWDVSTFPVWADADVDVNMADVHEALRGALMRVSLAAEKRPKLDDGCSFTVAVELRDDAEAPVGHPQLWIPSQPEGNRETHEDDASTTPIRSVQAGPLFFECWLEQNTSTSTSQSQSLSRDSFSS